MVQFRVRAQSLDEVAALLGNVIATFDGNMSAVDSQVQTALSNWEGEDSDEFSERWTTFMGLSAEVRMALTALQGGLVSASAGYTQNETSTQRNFTQARPGVVSIRKGAVKFGNAVQVGEDRAEDMAEFFGRDYAGDNEDEKFGGGRVSHRGGGRYQGGGKGDTDGDGDDDSIGQGPFLSNDSVEELYGEDSGKESGFERTEDGIIEQVETQEGSTGDSGDGSGSGSGEGSGSDGSGDAGSPDGSGSGEGSETVEGSDSNQVIDSDPVVDSMPDQSPGVEAPIGEGGLADGSDQGHSLAEAPIGDAQLGGADGIAQAVPLDAQSSGPLSGGFAGGSKS